MKSYTRALAIGKNENTDIIACKASLHKTLFGSNILQGLLMSYEELKAGLRQAGNVHTLCIGYVFIHNYTACTYMACVGVSGI